MISKHGAKIAGTRDPAKAPVELQVPEVKLIKATMGDDPEQLKVRTQTRKDTLFHTFSWLIVRMT